MWKKKFPFLLLVLVHVSGVFGSDELGEEISSYLESVRTLLTNHRYEYGSLHFIKYVIIRYR